MQLRDIAATSVPAARTLDLVTTESKDEVLVYDQAVHHIHHLNAVTATVWRLCDGTRSISDISVESGIEVEAVRLALRQLDDAKLLDGTLPAEMRGTQSRRAFMKKAAIAGAVAVPTIVSVSAPTAAQGNSCGGGSGRPNGCGCGNSNQCQSLNCVNGFCQAV